MHGSAIQWLSVVTVLNLIFIRFLCLLLARLGFRDFAPAFRAHTNYSWLCAREDGEACYAKIKRRMSHPECVIKCAISKEHHRCPYNRLGKGAKPMVVKHKSQTMSSAPQHGTAYAKAGFSSTHPLPFLLLAPIVACGVVASDGRTHERGRGAHAMAGGAGAHAHGYVKYTQCSEQVQSSSKKSYVLIISSTRSI